MTLCQTLSQISHILPCQLIGLTDLRNSDYPRKHLIETLESGLSLSKHLGTLFLGNSAWCCCEGQGEMARVLRIMASVLFPLAAECQHLWEKVDQVLTGSA